MQSNKSNMYIIIIFMKLDNQEVGCFISTNKKYNAIYLQDPEYKFFDIEDNSFIEITVNIFNYYFNNNIYYINAVNNNNEQIAVPVIKLTNDREVILINVENNNLFDNNYNEKNEEKINGLLDKIAKLNNEIIKLQNSDVQSKNKIKKTEDEKNDLESKYSKAQNDYKDCKIRIAELEDYIKKQSEKISQLEFICEDSLSKINTASDKISILEIDNIAKQNSINKFEIKYKTKEEENNNLQQIIDENQLKISSFESNLLELKNSLLLKEKFSEIINFQFYYFDECKYFEMNKDDLINEIKKLLTENKKIKILYNDILDNNI